ncbi:MAG: hypothetical protein ACRDDZ_06870 [Marinifilaceae bacterium]
MKQITLLIAIFALSVGALWAQEGKHELDNFTVSVPATDHKSARFINEKTVNGKTYIHGQGSSYKKNGTASTGKALMPYAEYTLSSKVMGGDYSVTVHYRLDKDKMPDKPHILVGMDLLEAEELQLEKKLINTVKARFKTKLLRGKNHTLKIWFPCEGVEVQKFEVRKHIISKK